jgi:hypothetical protein
MTSLKGGRLHNQIMNFIPSEDKKHNVDHINLNKKDNRRSNLRIATLSTQSRNRNTKK